MTIVDIILVLIGIFIGVILCSSCIKHGTVGEIEIWPDERCRIEFFNKDKVEYTKKSKFVVFRIRNVDE